MPRQKLPTTEGLNHNLCWFGDLPTDTEIVDLNSNVLLKYFFQLCDFSPIGVKQSVHLQMYYVHDISPALVRINLVV